MNRTAITLALAAGISCAAFGYEPQRHNYTFTTNGVTYAQRGGLGASDYVVTNIDASAIGKVTSVNGMDGDVVIDANSVGALSAFNYAYGNDRDALISTNDYSLPNGNRVVYNPSLVYSQNYNASKLDCTRIDGLNGTKLYELKNVGGNWIDDGYTHIMLGKISCGFGVEYSNGNDINTCVILRPNSQGYFALESSVAAAATAATNYTDTAIGAAIANTNPVFSNAVLAVGLNLDTNTVAAINALVEAGEELPIGGAATVGALLLALAAAVAALKRTKADSSALRYDLASETVINTASQETVEGATVNYGEATLADRTGNRVSITAALDELRVTFPPAVSGKLRDFGLRVEVGTGSAALTAPAIVPVAPTGETIKLENNAKQIPALADGAAAAKGVTLLYFSESAPGVFFAKGEQVGEVA